MRFVAMPALLLLLGGCAQYDAERQANLAVAEQARVAADDAACRSSGARPGSPRYEDCRKRFANQHAQEADRHNRLANEMLNAPPPIGGPVGQ
jgi:hypothetical protein